MSQATPQQRYDAPSNTVFIEHPTPIHLGTPDEIRAYFDAVVRFWETHCRGRRAYYLVNWNGFTTNIEENTVYAEHVRRVVDRCAVIIVRYTTNPLQRAAARFVSLKLHVPSNTYATAEEAMRVVEAHRAANPG